MKLKKIISQRNCGYEYGRHNLIRGNFAISSLENSYFFKNFYSGVSRVGVCNEQHEKYFKENKDLNLLRVLGTEPKYFSSKESNHFYLLAFNESLPKDFSFYLNEMKRDYILDKNPFVVDVSFGVFDRLSDSGYSVRKILDKFPINKNVELDKAASPRVVPLGVYSEEMFYLGARKELEVFCQKKGSLEVISAGGVGDVLGCVKRDSSVGKILGAIERKL